MKKLRKFTQEEINKIIGNHQYWLREDCEGWEDMKADLSYADLKGADLSLIDLRYANLYKADLYKADLRYANLYKANLYNADLRYANLYKANLYNADLYNADLRHADLSYANLENTNLRYADLSSANLENTKINYPLACPSEGSFTAWKKADGKIIKLQILEDSKRLSATTDKCRCDKALVLEIQDLDGNKLDIESVPSIYDKDFIYKVGEIVEVEDFDENRWNECSTGIHFFVDRQLAVNYLL